MKKMKRMLSLVIALTFVILAASCGNNSMTETDSTKDEPSKTGGESGIDLSKFNLDGTLPIVKTPEDMPDIKVAFVTGPERIVKANELDLIVQMKEETGLEFEWVEIPAAGSGEKINLMLNTGSDLPDFFWNGIASTTVAQYIDTGIFIPTEDLIEQYVPRLKEIYEAHPEYKAGSTAPNGHSYGFPYIEEMHGLVLTPGPFLINKSWLDAVNLDVPTTVDEYVEALRAFKEAGDLNGNGVDDEIPYAFGLGSEDTFGSYNTFHQFTAAFGLADSYSQGNYLADHLLIVDDKVVFTAADEAYKKTAIFFNMLNDEGLIDPDSFSPGPTADQPLFLNKLKDDKAVIGSFGVWAPANEIPDLSVREQYVAVPRLQGEEGMTGFALNFSEMQDTSMVAITRDCEYPELIASMVNYWMEPKNSITLNWGSIGMIYKETDEGYLEFDLDEDNNILLKDPYQTFGEMRSNSTPARGSLAVLNEYYDTYADYTWDAVDLLDFQKQNGKDEILDEYTTVPKMILSTDEQTRLTQIQPQLKAVVNRYTMEWILDGTADDTWDTYLSELAGSGLEEFLSIWQSAYDRFLENK